METSKQYQIPILTPWIKMTLHKNTNKTFWLSTNTFSRKRKITVFTRFYHPSRWVTCKIANFLLKIIKYECVLSKNDGFEYIVIWNFGNWLSHKKLLIFRLKSAHFLTKIHVIISVFRAKMRILNLMWFEIFQILTENCSFSIKNCPLLSKMVFLIQKWLFSYWILDIKYTNLTVSISLKFGMRRKEVI